MTLLALHIIIAVSSVAFGALLFFKPSLVGLRVSYLLITLTLLTGTLLIMKEPAHMLQACIMGLFYVGLITASTAVTRSKLAAQKTSDKYEQNV